MEKKMNNFFEADAIESAPDYKTLNSQGHATDGNPSLGVPATLPGAAWFDSVTQEIVNAIKAAGITPDTQKVNQLAEAIRSKASLNDAGIVQLSSAINSNSEEIAATSKAVKLAYDLANTANTKDVSGIPTGSLVPFAGAVIPEGYLLCNGAAVSRTTYAKLFAVIGTLWGSGDGSTTFNLPDFTDKFIEGTTDTANVAKFLEAGLPNITGTLSIWLAIFNSSSGAFTARRTAGTFGGGGETENNNLASFDASLSSTIYKDINTVQPASNQILIIIKT